MKKVLVRFAVSGALLAGTLAVAIPNAVSASPTAGDPNGFVTITCTNGYTFKVDAHAAKGITGALNNFNKYSHTGVTCSIG
jgi:hypothetical protein